MTPGSSPFRSAVGSSGEILRGAQLLGPPGGGVKLNGALAIMAKVKQEWEAYPETASQHPQETHFHFNLQAANMVAEVDGMGNLLLRVRDMQHAHFTDDLVKEVIERGMRGGLTLKASEEVLDVLAHELNSRILMKKLSQVMD